jgi:pSer/pThr/pTyr-binding forkhead associated (FHA) protein
MRTNLLSGTGTCLAWLDREIPGKEPERIDLDHFPFTLGRNETCDYQVQSSRVSRQHAQIVREGGRLRIRDLKSTNGTFVNGQRIEEHLLCDGDLIVIADVSFSFRTEAEDGLRKTVTQVMVTQPLAEPPQDTAWDLILAVRSVRELLLHRAIRQRFVPVHDLAENQLVGYEAICQPPLPASFGPAQEVLAALECPLNEHLAHLARMLAAEQAARLGGALLFLRVAPAEVGAERLPGALKSLAALAGGKQIVVAIPDRAVVDIPYFHEFRQRLGELGLKVAYDAFASSPHQLESQAAAGLAPDYLQLAPAMVRGVDKSDSRRQQLAQLVRTAAERGITLVACGVHSEGEGRTCRELGFRLAQGDYFGPAQTVPWPIEEPLS